MRHFNKNVDIIILFIYFYFLLASPVIEQWIINAY